MSSFFLWSWRHPLLFLGCIHVPKTHHQWSVFRKSISLLIGSRMSWTTYFKAELFLLTWKQLGHKFCMHFVHSPHMCMWCWDHIYRTAANPNIRSYFSGGQLILFYNLIVQILQYHLVDGLLLSWSLSTNVFTLYKPSKDCYWKSIKVSKLSLLVNHHVNFVAVALFNMLCIAHKIKMQS